MEKFKSTFVTTDAEVRDRAFVKASKCVFCGDTARFAFADRFVGKVAACFTCFFDECDTKNGGKFPFDTCLADARAARRSTT